MSFGVLMLNADRSVQGIGALDQGIGMDNTTPGVAPDYSIVVIEDDSQYVNTYSEASAYVCVDNLRIQPLVPC